VAPLGAVALGASVVEKHFTLSRLLPGPDHVFAIEPNELRQLVINIRLLEKMRGEKVKTVAPQEEDLRKFAHRGIQAIQQISIGDRFVLNKNIAVLRPGNQSKGLHAKWLPSLEGKTANRTLNIGEGIEWTDLL